MLDSKVFFEQERTCPVCERKFTLTRVRNSQCSVSKRDSDFCLYYEKVDPYLYGIWVCTNCGYAAPENIFSQLNEEEKEILKIALKGKEIKVDFSGERNLDVAMASHKLAIYFCELRHCKISVMAGLYLKLAWLYRKANNSKEKDYLQRSLQLYLLAYDEEPFPIGNLTELALRYLIGELYRRIGANSEAISWFNKVVSDKASKLEPKIVAMAREQWQLTKEEMKKNPLPCAGEIEQLPELSNDTNGITEEKKEKEAGAKKRLKVSSMIAFYEEQMDWVKKVVAHTNGEKILLNSDSIVRAVLDLVLEIDPTEIKCQTENDLTLYLLKKLKKGDELNGKEN